MHRSDSAPSGAPREAVRIVSVPLAGEIVVLFCAPLEGLLVHRVQGRPVACPGEGSCAPGVHRGRTLYYGYAPVRVWRARDESWVAAVLEVTEHLEELLRGRTLPGELWLLRRECERKKTGPCVGVFLETRAAADTPPPFDVRPALCRLYHTTELALGVGNPIPARVHLPKLSLSPPPGAEAFGLSDPPRPSEADAEALRRVAGRRMRKEWDALPRGNGHEKS